MSSTTPIETSAAPAAIGPYSQGRKGGGIIFVSGQLGLDLDLSLLEPTASEQEEQFASDIDMNYI